MSEQEGNVQASSEATQATADVQQNQVSSKTETTVNWRDSLPEDLKAEACLKDFKGVDSLAKSYAHLVKMQGNSIRIPGEDASPEAKEEFYRKLQQVEGVTRFDESHLDELYTRLGRPESVEGYEVPEVEGIKFDESAINDFKKLAFDKGLTKEQTKTMLQFYAEEKANEVSEHNALVANTETSLKKVWGDDYQNRLLGAKASLDAYRSVYGEDSIKQAEMLASLNPVLANLMADHYAGLKEKGAVKGEGSITFGVTPQEAAMQIAEMNSNREIQKILANPMHPDNKKYAAKRNELYRIATPYLKQNR